MSNSGMDTTVKRLFFMDEMRGVLMILGIFLHSSQVFNPDKEWLIYSNHTAPIAKYIVEFVAAFRMPAFFVVSGFFCLLLLKKYGIKEFAKNRAIRILIPLLSTAIILNSLQEFFLVFYDWKDFELQSYLKGGWVSHLWFLVNLVIYYLTVLFIAITTRKYCAEALNGAVQLLGKSSALIWLATLPCISLAILATNKIGFPLYSNIYNTIFIYSLLKYAPYFFFGMILASNVTLLRKFSEVNLFILIVCLILAVYGSKITLFPNSGLISVIANEYLGTLSTWLSVALCFGIFYRYFNVYSKRALIMSSSSYTIYLFHHLIVIAFGVIFIDSDLELLGGLSGLLMLIAITLLLTYVIHHFLITRVKLLGFLFNGKKL